MTPTLDPWPELASAALEAVLVGVHVAGGGVWIGAMVFSIFVLHPRAEAFFARGEDFEHFIFSVVHGARWKVVAGITAILASGLALAAWPPAPHALPGSGVWLAVLAAKLALFVFAAGCFVYVSWRLWPLRTFATPEELPALRQHFWRVGAAMVVANTLNMALGFAAHAWRGLFGG